MPNNGNLGFTYVAGISDGNANVTQNINITLDGLVILGGGALNTMFLPNNRTLSIVGGSSGPFSTGFINLDGTLHMQSMGNLSDLTVTAGPAGSTLIINSVVSPGELRMSDNIQNRIYGTTGTETIMFGTDVTVRGSGQLGLNLTALINQGTIIADQSTELRIDPNTAGLDNQGTLRAENGAELRLNSGPFTTSGSVFAAANSTVTRASLDFVQTAGSTIIDGSLVLNAGGTITIGGGVLGGSGTVSANVSNVTGIAAPGPSTGTLTISGDYVQAATGDFAVEVGGVGAGQFDVLAILGTANLAGSISISIINGFVPSIGDTFVVLTSGNTLIGAFDTMSTPNLPGGLNMVVFHNPNDVTLMVTGCLGDLNGDSQSDLEDFSLFAGCVSGPGQPLGSGCAPADLDGDGDSDLLDFGLFQAGFGCP